MALPKQYSIGIDPGFTETGAVLKVGDDVLDWVTMSCTDTAYADTLRAVALAGELLTQLVEWVKTYKIKALDVAIELPIYNNNPVTHMKQVRLMQEIESGIVFLVASVVKDCRLTEIYPSVSKRLSTGDGSAEKYLILSMSPFKDLKGLSKDTMETISDAWAHSLSAWNEDVGSRTVLSNCPLPAVEVRRNESNQRTH